MNLYPIVTTPDPARCRDFYVKVFGARVLFEADWFVHLAVDRWEIGFLHPNPAVPVPMFQHQGLTRGLCFALEVSDASALHRQLQRQGIETLGQPQQSRSGEMAFAVMDPAGVILNVIETPTYQTGMVEL